MQIWYRSMVLRQFLFDIVDLRIFVFQIFVTRRQSITKHVSIEYNIATIIKATLPLRQFDVLFEGERVIRSVNIPRQIDQY